MRNLLVYHLISLGPLLFILYLFQIEYLSLKTIMILVLVYGFVYRPTIDFFKLRMKGLVGKREYIRSLGFLRLKYYRELMFEA